MDRKQIKRQIKIVLVTFRAERGHRDSPEMIRFRDRAQAILRTLAPLAEGDARLRKMLRAAEREIREDKGTASGRSRFGEQAVDGSRQFLDGKGLRQR